MTSASAVWSILRDVFPARLALSCAVVAILATAFFFLLHHVGNQLPYDLAVERFKVALESDRPDEGHAKGYKSEHEYCFVSNIVLADARASGADEESALRRAVVLKMLRPQAQGSTDRTTCSRLEAGVNGSVVGERILRPRYWWGGKALYAIALRWLSVDEIREFTKVATRAAYLLLAASLLLLSPKMLLLAAPLVVFGAFFSGIEYWADVANGLPYLWTVLFAAGLALLTRRDLMVGGKGEVSSGTVPVYCFAAGTVSSFLWLGEGHTFLVVVWIGMVVWFGALVSSHGRPDMAVRTKRAALCIVLYGAGILICYVLGQAVKAMFLGAAHVWQSFWDGLVSTVEVTLSQSTSVTQTRDAQDVSAFLTSFYAIYWPDWLPAHAIPTFIAVFCLAASLGLAAFEARRGRRDLLWGVLWIVGLMSACSLTFLICDDLHYRTARFAFVPLALCLSCLVLSAWTTDWRRSWATMWELPVLLVVAGCVSWQLARSNLSAVAKMIDSVEHLQPIIRSAYDVYLDGNRLVYVREDCNEEDATSFFLHLHPVDVADLPVSRRPHGYDNLDFHFLRFGFRDHRCTALRILPDYELVAVHTGQYTHGKGRAWSGEWVSPEAVDKVIESVEDMRPVASSAFDVYLDEGRLVYVKEECSDEDVDAPFFLHLYPDDVADLRHHRRPHGYNNLDFVFSRLGLRGGGRCVAVRVLPDYEVVAIGTGQYVPGKGRRWSARFSFGAERGK